MSSAPASPKSNRSTPEIEPRLPSLHRALSSTDTDARYHEAQGCLSLRQGSLSRRAGGQGLGARLSNSHAQPREIRAGIGIGTFGQSKPRRSPDVRPRARSPRVRRPPPMTSRPRSTRSSASTTPRAKGSRSRSHPALPPRRGAPRSPRANRSARITASPTDPPWCSKISVPRCLTPWCSSPSTRAPCCATFRSFSCAERSTADSWA